MLGPPLLLHKKYYDDSLDAEMPVELLFQSVTKNPIFSLIDYFFISLAR